MNRDNLQLDNEDIGSLKDKNLFSSFGELLTAARKKLSEYSSGNKKLEKNKDAFVLPSTAVFIATIQNFRPEEMLERIIQRITLVEIKAKVHDLINLV